MSMDDGIRTLCSPSVLLLTALLATFPAEADSCLQSATTQNELNECAGKALQEAEAEMQQVREQIRKEKVEKPEFLEQFENAQRAWLAFREAELKALFPLDAGQYGSVFPMCYALSKAALTRQRIEQLREWLKGTEEGDVCYGSLPIRKK
jgi:uncharacterized protein YecT (DUF1311 family)